MSKTKHEYLVLDKACYLVFIIVRTDCTATGSIWCSNERRDLENLVELLKNQVNVLEVPLCDFVCD